MSIPSSFGGNPQEDPNHHFRNVCIEFKKKLKSTTEVSLLEEEMDKFINVAKQMHWNHDPSERYHKDTGEKAVNQVINEFRKYLTTLKLDPKKANALPVISALSEVESMIRSFKVV